MGVIPLEAMGTMMACTLCFYFMPKSPGSVEEVLHSWLQEYSWTEGGVPAALSSRNEKLASSQKLVKEPLFCVETAIKMLYWAKLAYTIQEKEVDEFTSGSTTTTVAGTTTDTETGSTTITDTTTTPVAATSSTTAPPTTSTADGADQENNNTTAAAATKGPTTSSPLAGNLPFALQLYGLHSAELIWEKQTDIKALLAWGGNTIMVAFKGTSSMENAMTDINVSSS